MGIVRSLFGGAAPLQPTGPAPFAQPLERDRQALFWWLKRNTSYTATLHNAQLWAEFVADWETWLRGQDDPYEHMVETWKYALDTQSYYERGLKRLSVGDRSVFDSKSSEGWLWKVNTALPGRRMEWDGRIELIAQQDGVPLSVLKSYYRAHEAAMAVAWAGWYDGMGFPYGSASTLLQHLQLDTALPEPVWSVAFGPGKLAPKDGIYEQVDANGHIVGGMRYFVKGFAAESEESVEFGPQATAMPIKFFLWRLLWEDTRYKDGKIPDEEQHYPTPEQSVAMAKGSASIEHLRCEAGQPCPRAGYWLTPAQTDSRQHFEQGQLMPSLGGDYGLTVWQWDVQQTD